MSFLKNMRMNLEDLGQGKGGGGKLRVHMVNEAYFV